FLQIVKAHPNFSRLSVLVRFDEDVGARAFHRSGKVDLQLRVIAGLECWNAKHRHGVIRQSRGHGHLLTYWDVLAQRNHRETAWDRAAEEHSCVWIVRRYVGVR